MDASTELQTAATPRAVTSFVLTSRSLPGSFDCVSLSANGTGPALSSGCRCALRCGPVRLVPHTAPGRGGRQELLALRAVERRSPGPNVRWGRRPELDRLPVLVVHEIWRRVLSLTSTP